MKRLAPLAFLAFASPALAEPNWEVCNQTSFILRVAHADIEDGALAVEGWDEALPGDCLAYETEEGTDRYLLAESIPAHAGGVREWKGDVELCAGADDFTADAEQSCALQNLGSRRYLRVAADEARTFLVEPEDYGDSAQTAGIQRLLRDAGFRVRRIDGIDGRTTRRVIRDFLKARELDSGLRGEALVKVLREAALERQSELGITVCNESSERIWSATALRRDGVWRSRGWWPVEVSECVQVANASVKGEEPHLFALQEDTSLPEDVEEGEEVDIEELLPKPDRKLRAVATKPSRFCISEGRFAALGRDQCTDRGYASASFRELDNEEDGIRVTLTDADFVAPSGTALRR